MTKIYGAMVLAILLMTASGCLCMPGTHTFCPDTYGQLIDQKTRLAVSNAKIQFTTSYGAYDVDVKTSSDQKGEFYIKKQSRLILYWFGDPIVKLPRYIIEANGYKKFDSNDCYNCQNPCIYYESSPDYSFDYKKPIRIRIELGPIDPNTPADGWPLQDRKR